MKALRPYYYLIYARLFPDSKPAFIWKEHRKDDDFFKEIEKTVFAISLSLS